MYAYEVITHPRILHGASDRDAVADTKTSSVQQADHVTGDRLRLGVPPLASEELLGLRP